MPWIIDYPIVLEQMRQQGLKCLYYNSGAFDFQPDAWPKVRGWIGEPDGSIRTEARELTRLVPAPVEANLADRLVRVWQRHLPGKVWVMPKSHWAYELSFGSREWMPAVIEGIRVDPGLLQERNTGAAIEFSPDESADLSHFVRRLLELLLGSDFLVAFPGRPALCTVHSHKQLWWTTPDDQLIAALDAETPDPVVWG